MIPNSRQSLIELNKWFCGSFTFDGSNLIGYINGDSIASVTREFQVVSSNNGEVNIGTSTQSRHFDGNISNVQVYNRALTEQEVQQNFNALRGRYGI